MDLSFYTVLFERPAPAMIDKTNFFEFLEYLCEAVLITDVTSNIVFVNSACAKMFGYTQEQMKAISLSDLINPQNKSGHADRVKAFIKNCGPPRQMMKRPVLSCLNAKGETIQARISISTLNVSNQNYGLAILHDYTSVQSELETLETESNVDTLTGLYNRRYLDQVLAPDSRTIDTWEKAGILFIDLDRFKPVNDNFGHDAGDNILREISKRLKNALRSNDLLFRIGGDEFLVLVDLSDQLDEKQILMDVSDKICHQASTPFTIEDRAISIGASIGAGIYPKDNQSLLQLVALTDDAMYQAKRKDTSLFFVDDL